VASSVQALIFIIKQNLQISKQDKLSVKSFFFLLSFPILSDCLSQSGGSRHSGFALLCNAGQQLLDLPNGAAGIQTLKNKTVR
jgi:hypothetical protein